VSPAPPPNPHGPADTPVAAPKTGGKWARVVVQLVGFCLGIGLLTWCAGIAFSADNRAQLAKLRDAHWSDVLLLVALSLTTLVLNSAAFWSMIRPVRRVPWRSVLGVNCVATALAYLPFKLSLVFRAAAHNRRDGVPLLTIGTWLGNVGAMMLAVIGPALLASVWRPEVDALWWAVAAGGTLAACAGILITARLFSHEKLWTRFERLLAGDAAIEPAQAWRRLVRRSQVLPRAHEGIRMLAHPSAVIGGAAIRAADIAAQSARFLVAAHIIGVDLPPEQAVAAAAAYFIIGAVAPTGSLGFREAGVFALLDPTAFAIVVLTVTAVEMVVNLACAVPAALLLRRSRSASTHPNT
jgi:hypothetical protein